MANRIKELRKAFNLTQTDLANKLNVKQNTISNWESERTEIDKSSVVFMCDLFNVSMDYLLGRDEQPPQSIFDTYPAVRPVAKRRVPMLGDIACGEPIYANEDRESYVEVGTDLNVDFCLTARGDSMIGARIRNGDIIFCRSQDMVNNGEIAAVIIGDEVTLKRVYYYPDRQKLVLQAENPKYEPFVYVGDELSQIHILGKAVAFQSDIE